MKLVLKIIKFEINNTLRSKWLIIYSAFFLLLGFLLFNFEEETSKAALSLMNIVLFVIPLVSIVFGTVYIYNSINYIQMVLCQPIDRRSLYLGLFFGNSIPLAFGFFIGTALGILLNGFELTNIKPIIILIGVGVILTFIFTAIALWIALRFNDKARGLGVSIIIWLFLSVIYDGIVLFLIYFFRDYPIENFMIALSLINPVDLGRIFFILEFDISALMGYTGALFQKFFGSTFGSLVSVGTLLFWIIVPVFFGLKSFSKKDF